MIGAVPLAQLRNTYSSDEWQQEQGLRVHPRTGVHHTEIDVAEQHDQDRSLHRTSAFMHPVSSVDV
jgi:hypothetical protein